MELQQVCICFALTLAGMSRSMLHVSQLSVCTSIFSVYTSHAHTHTHTHISTMCILMTSVVPHTSSHLNVSDLHTTARSAPTRHHGLHVPLAGVLFPVSEAL